MSDMLASVVGTVTSGNTVFAPKTSSADEQRFSDMLKEADKKTSVAPAKTAVNAQTAAEKFMTYQEMTPAEKFRASYLAEKNLTEEDIANMSAEDRAKIESEIMARIREKLAQSFSARTAS